MLARPYRLPAGTRLTHPKTITTTAFTLKYAPSPLSHSRCLVVISKAVDKRSTKRNELRRVILHALQPHLRQFKTPQDLLIILRRDAVAFDHDGLSHLLLESLTKEDLL